MSPFPRAAYRPLEPYAPDRRPIELDLSDNTSRWGAHPGALRAIREAVAGAGPDAILRYPPVYADRLKQAVAARFGVPEGSVATGCGSDDLLDSAFRAVCEPGEGVRFLPPTFSMIEIFARMNGLEPMPLERPAPASGPDETRRRAKGTRTAADGGAGHLRHGPLPDPERVLDDGPALVYLCRPNNPTGEVHPRAWVEALVRAGGPAGPVILIDEAYADFMEPEIPFVREAAESSRVVVFRTLSKAYGLAGLRIGFAVGAPEVIREIEKSRGPYKVSRLGEAAGAAALEDRANWLAGILQEVRTERERLAEALRDRGLPALPSGANFLCVPLGVSAARAAGAERAAGAASAEEAAAAPVTAASVTAAAVTAALRERGVAVRPFPALPGLGEAIRASVGTRAETDRFLAALDRSLEELGLSRDATDETRTRPGKPTERPDGTPR
jgi:histidinol-phosphate/aromatic aminotransferase/cobyric acid decarboxylase-like protein